METLYSIPAWQIALGLFALMVVAAKGGRALGRRGGRGAEEGPGGIFMSVMGAVLGLLSLLLGFSYSMAASRYDHHKQLLVHETNAFGTSYLRAGLLADPAESEMRDLLRSLVEVRLTQHDDGLDPAREQQAAATTERLQAQLWELAAAEARRDPRSLSTAQVVQSVNELIDASTARTAYYRNHVPETILLMLLAVSLVCAALVGYAFGRSRQPNWLATVVFAAVVAVVTLALLDLDRPRRGLIRTGQRTMLDFQADIHSEE
jgi:hypothetical protein